MAFITDTFTEPTDVTLASHTGESGVTYTDHPHANYTATFEIDAATDRIYSTGTAAHYADVTPPSADYEVEADFYLHSAISQNIAICVRMDTTADTMIIARLNNGTIWELREIVATNSETLGSSTNQLPSAGTSKRGKLRVRGTEAWLYVEGVLEIGPVTVSVTDAGRAGVRNAGAASATTGIHLDNLSVSLLNASVALFRGRNFPFFDDEEVNRFEFWPAVSAGVTEHERAVAVSATGSVATSAESFSVFARSAAVSATAAITTSAQFFTEFQRATAIDTTGSVSVSGERVVERSVSLSATGSIAASGEFFSVLERAASTTATVTIAVSAQFFTELERSAALDSTTSVAVSGARVVDRAVSLSSAATVEVSGQPFTVFESAAAVSASSSIQTSATFFSVFERVASLSATASIVVDGLRIIERSVSVTATVTIESSAQSFSVLERTASITATGTIQSSAISIIQRQASVSATATIASSRQVELSRQSSVSAAGSIAVTGGVLGGVFEHERSAALSAVGEIATVATVVSVLSRTVAITATSTISASGLTERERASSLATVGSIVVGHQRVLLRTISLPATATITVSGSTEGAAFNRAVSLSGASSITVNYTVQHPTPPRRTFMLSSSQRTVVVQREQREFKSAPEQRETVVQ